MVLSLPDISTGYPGSQTPVSVPSHCLVANVQHVQLMRRAEAEFAQPGRAPLPATRTPTLCPRRASRLVS